MPAAVMVWMGAIQGLIQAAPDIIAFAAKVKGWIADLFSAGIITAEQQNELHARVTAICAAALNNTLPPHWQVEADPTPKT